MSVYTVNSNFKKNAIPIKLQLSDPAPDSVLSIDKEGHKLLLLWDNQKISAGMMVTNEIPHHIFLYMDALIKIIHLHNIHVNGYFYIGHCYTIIKSPYIYRLTLIETHEELLKYYNKENNNKKKYPLVLFDCITTSPKTTIIEKTLIVEKKNEASCWANAIADSIYCSNYKDHIMILSVYCDGDILSIIIAFLIVPNL